MKKLRASLALLATASILTSAALAQNESAEFPGVQKAMTPKAFEGAGLNKLSPEERARLDDFIRGFVSASSAKAANVAVEKAVQEKKAAPPEVVESRIVGPFNGYNGRNQFTLENGQVWAQSQRDVRSYPPTDSPPCIIVKTGLGGHRMYILGGGNIRVSKVR